MMSKQQAAAILPAADRWKQRCLLDGGSLFSDERLWTRQNFEQLRIHVVESPDAGSDPSTRSCAANWIPRLQRRSVCGRR